MFIPKYTITTTLLNNIKTIYYLIGELNTKRFPDTVKLKLEREAKAISAQAAINLESNPLSLNEVKTILKTTPEHITDKEREVINYSNTLELLNRNIKELNTIDNELILSIHKSVMDNILHTDKLGMYRTEAIFVNDQQTGNPIYSPPNPPEVNQLMNDLTTFIITNRNVANPSNIIDPLILAGIFHKQFILIHPFIYGNDRTCELITKVILNTLNIQNFEIFSFENFYNNNTKEYLNQIGETGNYYEKKDSLDYTIWLEYFTQGILEEIQRIQKELEKLSDTPEFKLNKDREKIIEIIKQNGYITDSEYSKVTKRAKATRVIDFNYLIKEGYISRQGKGRETYYIIVDK